MPYVIEQIHHADFDFSASHTNGAQKLTILLYHDAKGMLNPCAVVTGYSAYHTVPMNILALRRFRYHVMRLWLRTLRRRSQKDKMTWARLSEIAGDWLPTPRILHPWPSERFAVKHPR